MFSVQTQGSPHRNSTVSRPHSPKASGIELLLRPQLMRPSPSHSSVFTTEPARPERIGAKDLSQAYLNVTNHHPHLDQDIGLEKLLGFDADNHFYRGQPSSTTTKLSQAGGIGSESQSTVVRLKQSHLLDCTSGYRVHEKLFGFDGTTKLTSSKCALSSKLRKGPETKLLIQRQLLTYTL